jgi:hypothetical protein
VDQQPLQNVRVSAQIHAAQATGFIEMCKMVFKAFATQPQQSLPARATDAPAIAIDGVARRGLALPATPTAIGFRNVAPDLHRFEIDQLLIAVIALIPNHF